jgi:hypothetical protein
MLIEHQRAVVFSRACARCACTLGQKPLEQTVNSVLGSGERQAHVENGRVWKNELGGCGPFAWHYCHEQPIATVARRSD